MSKSKNRARLSETMVSVVGKLTLHIRADLNKKELRDNADQCIAILRDATKLGAIEDAAAEQHTQKALAALHRALVESHAKNAELQEKLNIVVEKVIVLRSGLGKEGK